MKMGRVGAELFHADGQEDMAKLIVAFCNFANTPKNNYRTYINILLNKEYSL